MFILEGRWFVVCEWMRVGVGGDGLLKKLYKSVLYLDFKLENV